MDYFRTEQALGKETSNPEQHTKNPLMVKDSDMAWV